MFSNNLLCSPVFCPQMVGGVLEAVVAVTENWSVKHRPALEAAAPPSELLDPAITLVTD